MIHRRVLLTSLLASTALARGAAAAPRRPAKGVRPNIITIVLDDVGFSVLGWLAAEIRTPRSSLPPIAVTPASARTPSTSGDRRSTCARAAISGTTPP